MLQGFFMNFAIQRTWKALAGGLAGGGLMAFEPLLKAFQSGLITGAGDSFEQLGIAVGQFLAGAVVSYIIVWLSPKNKEA